MLILEEETLQQNQISFQFPFRQIIRYYDEFYNETEYNALQMEWFEDIKTSAEQDWNSSNMIQYLRDNLEGEVSELTLKVIGGNPAVARITAVVSPTFDDSQVEELKDWITGQMSDGWGEGFEQREIATFTYEDESEEFDEDEQEFYTDSYNENAYVYGQFWWNEKKVKALWYIKEI